MQSIHYTGYSLTVQAVETVNFSKHFLNEQNVYMQYTKFLPERSCLVIKLSGFDGNALSPVVMRRATQIIQDCKSTIKFNQVRNLYNH